MLKGKTTMVVSAATVKEALALYFRTYVFATGSVPMIKKMTVPNGGFAPELSTLKLTLNEQPEIVPAPPFHETAA